MTDAHNKSTDQDPNELDPNAGEGKAEARKIGFLGKLRAYFFAGILITAPIFITFYLAWLFVHFVDSKVTPLIPAKYNPETYLPFGMPGLGLIVLIIAMTMIGALTAGFVGRLYVRASERLLNRMPIIRGIYGAIKQVLETVLAQKSNAFRKAVLVEYPRRGIWAVAFITGTTQGEIQSLTEDECVNIFLPTTPNPTSGFLLFVPKKELTPLSMTVEEAMKMVISGGIVTPVDRRPADVKAKPVVSAATYENLDILRESQRTPILIPKNHPLNSETES